MIKLVVLNLLKIEAMSVYDIKATLSKMDATRWANILIGSIQNAVNSLSKSGDIEVDSIVNVGKRKKTIYRITKQGSELQKELTIEAIGNIQPNLPNDFFVGLSGIETNKSGQVHDSLLKSKKSLLKEKEAYIAGIKEKETFVELDELQKTIVSYTIRMLDEQINLIDELNKIIGE